jgi:glycosyltransferase involved in cell wall biosynthesis
MARIPLARRGNRPGAIVPACDDVAVARSTSKPLVVQVITRLIVGGAQLSVLELCRGLGDEFDLRVICGPDQGAEGSLRDVMAQVAPVTVVPTLRRDIRPGHDFAAMFTLRRLLEESGAVIVHTHSSKAGILGRLAARGPTKVVHTIHGWGHTPAHPGWLSRAFVALERRAANRSDALIAVSSDVREEGLRHGIGDESRYRVIPEVVDFSATTGPFVEARREARRRLGLGSDEPVIGWVGRFVPQKDPATLVAALNRVLAERPTARAVLVGDGPMRIDVEDELARRGNARRVIFTGVREDARALYPAFDVVMHVSRWEGQPLVVQEAIAERVPVVATDAEGVKDLIVEGLTGYVVEPGDVAAVAQATSGLLNGSSLRAPLDDAAVAEVARRNGREIAIARHVELYRELVADGSADRA